VQNKEMLESPNFKRLVTKRWTVSLIHCWPACSSPNYGYIMLIAYNHAFMASKINPSTG